MQTHPDPLFCLPGPSWLVHHLVHPSTHLRTPLCTSAHLCAPLHTLLHTSVHPCATFALHFPGLVTLIGPSILTSDPFGYLGQLSPSATRHNAHPRTSVESSPNSAAPIWPICFSLWACTTHIAIQGPCPAGSPLPKWHIFSLGKFFPLFLGNPWGTSGYTTLSTNVPIHHHGDTYPQPSLYVQPGLHPHPRLHPHHPPPGGLSVGCCFYGLGHWLGVGGSFRSTLGSLRPLSSLCPLGSTKIFFLSFFFTRTTCKIFCEYIFNLFFNFFQTFSNLTLTCIYMFFLLLHGLRGLGPKGGALSQLATGCVTCHACHGCVMDFRPILGNPMEVTHVTSLGHVYIFPH